MMNTDEADKGDEMDDNTDMVNNDEVLNMDNVYMEDNRIREADVRGSGILLENLTFLQAQDARKILLGPRRVV